MHENCPNVRIGSNVPCTNIAEGSRYRYISTRTLLLPEDMHTALAVPGEAGASGVLAYEDGTAQVGEPKHAATQAYIDKVLGPTATALYGGRTT